MRIGECYWVRTESVYCEEKKPNSRPKVKGRVIYIHPRGRYATLEIPEGIRECFGLEELTPKNRICM